MYIYNNKKTTTNEFIILKECAQKEKKQVQSDTQTNGKKVYRTKLLKKEKMTKHTHTSITSQTDLP